VTAASRSTLAALASLSAGLFLAAVALRVFFPYELTPVEALQPLVVDRLIAGLPIYPEPTPQYTGPVYTPLSFVLGAALSHAFGLTLPVLRVLSIAATLATALIVYLALRAHQAPRMAAAICAAMLPAAHTRLGDGLDIARVDAPQMCLAMLGVAASDLACRAEGRRQWLWTVAAAAALSAAVMTKQPAATAVAGAAVATWLAGRRAQALGLGALAAAGVFGAGVALHATSGGWSTYYLLTLPGYSPVVAREVGLALGRLAFFFPGALAACVLVLWRLRHGQLRSGGLSAWEVTLALSVPAAVVTNARVGGADNVWMMVVPLAAVVLGRYWTEYLPRLSWRHLLFYPIALQAAVLPHRPIAQLPTPADRQMYEAFVSDLRQRPGPIFNPAFPYESLLAGHEPSPLVAQLVDYPPGSPVLDQLGTAFRERRFATLVVDNVRHRLLTGLEGNYREDAQWPIEGPAFSGIAHVLQPIGP
jgi:hypothetical protein